MDNLTHSLFALTLARTPLGRAGRGATVTLVLASNAPDSDIAIALTHGGGAYLTAHRGSSHGPLGVVGFALVVASLVYLGLAWRRRKGPVPSPPEATWPRLVALALVGTLGHVLMDLPTSYGTRSLSPFEDRWFTIDLMPIVDVYLLALLGGGLAAVYARRKSQGAIAAVVLMLMLANYGLRAGMHARALGLARSGQPPAPTLSRWPDAPYPKLPDDFACAAPPCALSLAALPTFGSPLVWRIVRQSSGGYQLADLNVWSGVEEPIGSEPSGADAAVTAARRAGASRQLLRFSRFPTARIERHGDDTLVRFSDVRFLSRPLSRRGEEFRPGGLFSVTVRLDRHGRILDERFGS